MKPKPKSIDSYLAPLAPAQRSALTRLRKAIRAAAPEAKECICYHLPAYRLRGKFILAFGYGAKHCAFYPGAQPIFEHRAALAGFDTSKGTIRFQPESPLPIALIRKLVKSRVAEFSQPR